MAEKKTIKIVKKEDRNRKQQPVEKNGSARDTARQMVQTVTNWVNEMQQKRRAETVDAVKSLLPPNNNPRPSEA